MEMELQNKIRALKQREREAVGQEVRIRPHSPAADPAGLRKAGTIESAVVACLTAFAIVLPRFAARIEEE